MSCMKEKEYLKEWGEFKVRITKEQLKEALNLLYVNNVISDRIYNEIENEISVRH